MIISRVELKSGRLIDGQTIRQFRRVDGYEMHRDGCALVVTHESGWRIELPFVDVITAFTEPPALVGREVEVVPVKQPPVFASAYKHTKVPDPDDEPTRVTRMPKK